MEERIAEAVAKTERDVAAHQAAWVRIFAEMREVLAEQSTRRPEIDCPCCGVGLDGADDYRDHIVNAPSYCNRERWGSEVGVDEIGDDSAADSS